MNETNNKALTAEEKKQKYNLIVALRKEPYQFFESICWRYFGQTLDTLLDAGNGGIGSGTVYPMIIAALCEYADKETAALKEETERLRAHITIEQNDNHRMFNEISLLKSENERLKQRLSAMVEALEKIETLAGKSQHFHQIELIAEQAIEDFRQSQNEKGGEG